MSAMADLIFTMNSYLEHRSSRGDCRVSCYHFGNKHFSKLHVRRSVHVLFIRIRSDVHKYHQILKKANFSLNICAQHGRDTYGVNDGSFKTCKQDGVKKYIYPEMTCIFARAINFYLPESHVYAETKKKKRTIFPRDSV